LPSESAPHALAHTPTHARARLHAHRAVPGWHAPSIIGMRDLQAAAARICVCEGGRGDCRQNLPRTHSHTHPHARAHACMPTALCRDGTRRVSSACAICKLLLREYAFARGGGVIAVRFCPARTRTHTHTRARTLACPPRCAGMARAEYHRHARSASCCCENMRMRWGEG
jgi:hypothetical protein